VVNRVESTEYSRATTLCLYTVHLTLPMVGIGQLSRLNTHGLPLHGVVWFWTSVYW